MLGQRSRDHLNHVIVKSVKPLDTATQASVQLKRVGLNDRVQNRSPCQGSLAPTRCDSHPQQQWIKPFSTSIYATTVGIGQGRHCSYRSSAPNKAHTRKTTKKLHLRMHSACSLADDTPIFQEDIFFVVLTSTATPLPRLISPSNPQQSAVRAVTKKRQKLTVPSRFQNANP